MSRKIALDEYALYKMIFNYIIDLGFNPDLIKVDDFESIESAVNIRLSHNWKLNDALSNVLHIYEDKLYSEYGEVGFILQSQNKKYVFNIEVSKI